MGKTRAGIVVEEGTGLSSKNAVKKPSRSRQEEHFQLGRCVYQLDGFILNICLGIYSIESEHEHGS